MIITETNAYAQAGLHLSFRRLKARVDKTVSNCHLYNIDFRILDKLFSVRVKLEMKLTHTHTHTHILVKLSNRGGTI